jgi:hypothetical protein
VDHLVEPAASIDGVEARSGQPMPGSHHLAAREIAEAIEEYKRKSGRKFPTWSEVLEVVMGLGYTRPGRPPRDVG